MGIGRGTLTQGRQSGRRALGRRSQEKHRR